MIVQKKTAGHRKRQSLQKILMMKSFRVTAKRFRRESISFATNSTKSAGSVKLLRRCAKKLYDLLNSLVARIMKTRLSSIEVRLHLFLRLSNAQSLLCKKLGTATRKLTKKVIQIMLWVLKSD